MTSYYDESFIDRNSRNDVCIILAWSPYLERIPGNADMNVCWILSRTKKISFFSYDFQETKE